ncbi:MAG: bacillithiol biosynthesis deacetylase BshB1 [Bacteroidetes bacterium CG12_big_fil_rev_8_21_14_0_65_60_17]|nr:MAG: bacillithiol biosynthesis deacetylase BshB1 [Bacteroidetes bacterium CG12_big_fil_rev_8_21_14_0_65_60_17]
MTCDVVAFAAHPDDVELFAGGTVCTLVDRGHRVGLVDLTRGELGSRGTPEIRAEEARRAAGILGASLRLNLELPDGNIQDTVESRLRVIKVLRSLRPRIVLINAPECRHPDHVAASRLVANAAFHSGLTRIETRDTDGRPQQPWRPHHILHYIQSIELEPTLVVDVSAVWERRMQALRAYASQFHSPDYEAGDDEPETFVSNPAFMDWIEARMKVAGYRIGATYGEPFIYRHGPIGTDDLFGMLEKEKPFR